jgi:hypothetical protein
VDVVRPYPWFATGSIEGNKTDYICYSSNHLMKGSESVSETLWFEESEILENFVQKVSEKDSCTPSSETFRLKLHAVANISVIL